LFAMTTYSDLNRDWSGGDRANKLRFGSTSE
jgi:hypothetical protein